MTSPAPDVWPSILTDYTYDSEMDIADDVPRSISTQLDVPGGEHNFAAHNNRQINRLIHKTCKIHNKLHWNNCLSINHPVSIYV